MNSINKSARAELERIRLSHRGILKPGAIVDAARAETSPLHKYFEWSDTEAAELYRQQQARELIRVCVNYYEHKGERHKVRAYWSVIDDKGAHTYRDLGEILDDDELRARLLEQALEDLQLWKTRYDQLRQVATIRPVFEVIDGVPLVQKPKRKRS